MLAKAGELPRSDDGWAYEFKWDGIRAVVLIDHGSVRAISRGEKDLTVAFPELADLAAATSGHRLLLDGELVAFDDDGRPSFGRLQQRLNLTSPAVVAARAADVPASYLVFDLLALDDNSLLDLPYDDRRALLEKLDLNGESWATPPSFPDASGAAILDAARAAGLEGVMVKRRTSTYLQGQRSSDWLKVKIVKMQEVVIGGWTAGEGERRGSLGALLLGVYDDGVLTYVGKVGTGFDARARKQLIEVLSPLVSEVNPFVAGGAPKPAPTVQFVEPSVVGEVGYGEWTRNGHLRHPVWRGLRVEKVATDVVREDREGR
jgi:bifunctional non-homologous end joining protein LigD